jgi:succinylarginine dihydrolase
VKQAPSSAREAQFDGIVGPTHNYAGLSRGNMASEAHAGKISNPRAAARQGLAKMRLVHELGVVQAVLPPQDRPSLPMLRRLGFAGSDEEVIASAAKNGGFYLRACSSASSMWAANAATVTPSSDAADGRVHLTPANLQAMFHRAIEAPTTERVLRAVFADEACFAVHEALPGGGQLGDEGDANHLRVASSRGAAHVFAWGRTLAEPRAEVPKRHPARQTRDASEAVARLHRLATERVLFPQQHPGGIDGGAFHTDVLAASNGRFLMLHELAFVDSAGCVDALRRLLGDELFVVEAKQRELPLESAVSAYPFNSQILTIADGSMVILAPEDSREEPAARAFLERVVESGGPVTSVRYVDVRQSMQNGGGPACLRLRVPLADHERSRLGGHVLLDEALHETLCGWVDRHYRDRLSEEDLADPLLAREGMGALDELTRILDLGSLYDFQGGARS